MLQLSFQAGGQIQQADSVMTYVMLLTGSVQFAEELLADRGIAATIKTYLRAGMSARGCAMRITGIVITRAIADRFAVRPHQKVFFGKRKFCRADCDSLTAMIHCICDRTERWRRSGAMDGESARQLTRQLFDALRGKSESWMKATFHSEELPAAA